MRSLYRMLKRIAKRKKKPSAPPMDASAVPTLLADLDRNIESIKAALGNSMDLTVKEMRLGTLSGPRLGLVYLEGMTDIKLLLQCLMPEHNDSARFGDGSPRETISYLKQTAVTVGEIKEVGNWDEVVADLLSGHTMLFIHGCAMALAVGTSGGEKRGVEEPNTQSVIRGPREGFTETLRTNTAMVRRIVKDARVRLEGRRIGKVTKTDVAIMYLDGFASENVVSEVRARLDRIDTDGILESGYIEEFIQDKTYTPFPTVYNTERPDSVAAGIMEGRVAIFVGGTPFVLLVPALFTQFFQTPEDYYQRADFSSLLRILRFICFFIALLAPSIYIAVTTFHQELLPTPLLIGLAGQREGVPFPAFIEALIMEVTFEILREAGVRMPKTIGQSVSIVGTLVIGQAAVEAGLVSAAMVIVVSITAISNFVIPAFNMAISLRMLRFPFMGIAASFGLFGVVVCLIGLVLHLCSLKSFGVPYMAPFAPIVPADHKDSFFRLPIRSLTTRPRLLNRKNMGRRQGSGEENP